jgi:hypothetical protein
MSLNQVKRGGLAGVLAAALFLLTTILSRIAPVETAFQSPTDYLQQVVMVLAFAATIGAVLGLHALQRAHPRYGRVGAVGSILTILAYGTVLLVVVGIVLGGRSITEVRIAGALTVLVGSALLGVATLRARLVPWWCGVLLIVAFPIGDVLDGVFAGGEGIMLALLWGSVGLALLTRTGSPVQPAKTPVAS